MGCCQEQERGPWRVEGSWVVRTYRGDPRWPKATHRGRRPPAREASVPAPQGPRRRAAKRLELLLVRIYLVPSKSNIEAHQKTS